MNKWENILLSPKASIIQTMKIIDETTLQFAIVIDENKRILGTVTDGDIRRGILKGLSLDTSIKEVMNCFPVFETIGKEVSYYKEFMKKFNIKQLPIVNKNKQICNVLFLDNMKTSVKKKNRIILMAGGLGTRLRPLTDYLPKPMLKVGEKPILESIIESFKVHGFNDFILSVNYKKEKIIDYFQDGRNFDVNISYI